MAKETDMGGWLRKHPEAAKGVLKKAKLKKMAKKVKKPEYNSGWEQHKAESREGKKIEREEKGLYR